MQSGYLLTLSFLSFHLWSYRTLQGQVIEKHKQLDVRLNGGKKHEHSESPKTNVIANF